MRRMIACLVLFAWAVFAAEPGGFAPQRWRLAKPVSYQNLTIYPVLSDQTWETSAFLTLDEGLASGKVEVKELDAAAGEGLFASGPQVNRLGLANRSGRPLLLLAGEIIIGGKQDRIISYDQIIPPGDKLVPVSVFCVEPGRWQGRQDHFGALKAIVNPTVREQAVAHKSQQGVWARGAEARQSVVAVAPASANGRVIDGVWIPHGPEVRPLGSASTSYAELYLAPAAKSPISDSAAALKAQYEQALRAELKGQPVVGVVVEINKRPVWADVFASPSLFEKYWPKLLSSYAVEAIAQRGKAAASAPTAQQFLQRADAAASIEKVGRAYELLRSETGAALTYQLLSRGPEKLPIHLTRFERR